jgi:hypothetical protein
VYDIEDPVLSPFSWENALNGLFNPDTTRRIVTVSFD